MNVGTQDPPPNHGGIGGRRRYAAPSTSAGPSLALCLGALTRQNSLRHDSVVRVAGSNVTSLAEWGILKAASAPFRFAVSRQSPEKDNPERKLTFQRAGSPFQAFPTPTNRRTRYTTTGTNTDRRYATPSMSSP